jgi:Zn ribbon nucleic-acid-binding protein
MTGDPCPRCSGRIKVLDSFKIGTESQVRYHGCGKCGYRPPNNKTVCRRNRKLDNLSPTSIIK